jgi:hypothetical protein
MHHLNILAEEYIYRPLASNICSVDLYKFFLDIKFSKLKRELEAKRYFSFFPFYDSD